MWRFGCWASPQNGLKDQRQSRCEENHAAKEYTVVRLVTRVSVVDNRCFDVLLSKCSRVLGMRFRASCLPTLVNNCVCRSHRHGMMCVRWCCCCSWPCDAALEDPSLRSDSATCIQHSEFQTEVTAVLTRLCGDTRKYLFTPKERITAGYEANELLPGSNDSPSSDPVCGNVFDVHAAAVEFGPEFGQESLCAAQRENPNSCWPSYQIIKEFHSQPYWIDVLLVPRSISIGRVPVAKNGVCS